MRKRSFIFGMALTLMLINAPILSEASEMTDTEVMSKTEESEVQASEGELVSWRVEGDTMVITELTIPESSWYHNSPFQEMQEAMRKVEHVRFENCKAVGSIAGLFEYQEQLKSIDFQELDTSQVMDMHGMFEACSGLTSLDLSGFDTSQVTSMMDMFCDCSGLISLDLSGFDTSQVTNMSAMFYGCSGLTILDVSNFDTSQIEEMVYMFSGCSSLTMLDLSSFDTSQVKSMHMLLEDCDALITIKAFKTVSSQTLNICDLPGTDRDEDGFKMPGTYIDENGNKTTQITAEFAGKTLRRVGVANPAEQQVHDFVSRMYTVVLGRVAEEAGMNDWTNRLLNHETDGAGIANGFIMSDEFTNKNISDGDYVDILYHTFFDREADYGGKATWTETLVNGNSRSFVLAGFVNSTEFDNLCNSYGIVRGEMQTNETTIGTGVHQFVERCYNKVLGREGEKAGVDDWTGRIARGEQTPESVAKLFFFSEEYANKNTGNEEFVETLYQTFMDRASDPAGKSDWVGRLAGGMSREEVLEGFSRSEEFAGILKSFGL